MNPIQWDKPDRRLGAPRDWDHEEDGLCRTLEIIDRAGYMISAWQPTEAEKKRIVEGKVIMLWIKGTIHPVVSLTVQEE